MVAVTNPMSRELKEAGEEGGYPPSLATFEREWQNLKQLLLEPVKAPLKDPSHGIRTETGFNRSIVELKEGCPSNLFSEPIAGMAAGTAEGHVC